MKKKQKINKVVNHGELVLLGLTALFLCFLFAIRGRPAPERALTVRTLALPGKSAEPAPVLSDAEPAPVTSDGEPAPATPDSAAPPTSDTDTPADSAGLVNINTADLSALCALPGIGEALAGRVIAYREEHGAFERPEDIMNVSGIGQGKFAALRGLITTEEKSVSGH
ncbi:MAG: helix-hairpin-helix domain-containing protein [Oscillibacter sp.]|nr:helix-hairpin-helix domain-containing protein [Oscillibacter sp.]